MVQDIFKSLWEKRESLEIKDSLEHYLVRAAKLKVFEYYRRETARNKNLSQHYQFKEEDHSTLRDLQFNDLISSTWKELRHLPTQTQRIFIQSRQRGLSNKEIALVMQVSEKTVEYHISKALNVLKKSRIFKQ